MAFEYVFHLGMSSVDAAGVLFYPELFRHAHDAYEAFMAERGADLAQMVREGRLGLPIVHAEADYLRPLRHGERVRVRVGVSEVRERSFSIQCEFVDPRAEVCARVRTAHVCVGRDSGRAVALPGHLRAQLRGAGRGAEGVEPCA